MKLPKALLNPPYEFSVMPFWFLNDDLDDKEMVRQIEDFEKHGVHGFVLHSRVGLPRNLGWMSDELLHFYQVAVEEANARKMKVALYDEASYPSGSSSGQVVRENPSFACRCLAKVDLVEGAAPVLAGDENLVAIVRRRNGERMAVVDRSAGSVIRGIHYLREDSEEEDTPPAADILNPGAVAAFIRLVHDRFAQRFSGHFGKTIVAMFTDEPSVLGRGAPEDVRPGTTGILEHVNRILGYDFTPHLPALWYDDEPGAKQFRKDYHRAVHVRLEETYYQPIHDWCETNGLALTGHPHKPDDLGPLRLFHIPGQDSVWRWVLPDSPTALEGPESTQAKCSSSAMVHYNRQRNANECCGAYGHGLTWEEMQWLARWCFVRGVNMLFPHAFYYSVRGLRKDERPPDVGPHSPWWSRYREYADACGRISWLNTDCSHVCEIAILGQSNYLPWRAAKVCYQNQKDFNYLEERDLVERAIIDGNGIRLGSMSYRLLITEQAYGIKNYSAYLLRYDATQPDAFFVESIEKIVEPDIRVKPHTRALRVRHVRKSGLNIYLLFNEEKTPFEAELIFREQNPRFLFDAVSGSVTEMHPSAPVRFDGHELKVVLIENKGPMPGEKNGSSK